MLPPGGLQPYGPINNFYLPLGATNSLDILGGNYVDIQEANLTVIAFKCIPINLQDIQQLNVPATCVPQIPYVLSDTEFLIYLDTHLILEQLQHLKPQVQ